MNAFDKNTQVMIDDAQLLADEAKYSSFGDTVHYVDPPKIFRTCEGSYMYDSDGVPFLDLQMWYSAVNFGYGNKRLNNVLKNQIDLLPQVASQYLHQTRIELVDLHRREMPGQDRAQRLAEEIVVVDKQGSEHGF